MRDLLEHRGPDAAGLWSAPGITLGHRRLSIIDLSEQANQPLRSHSGRSALVFNGEIYNFAELRDQLDRESARDWRSNSDSEVLLEALEAWGPGALDQLVGMFAFATYEKSARRLTLVRDRIGVKPLYYAVLDQTLLFASEIKALRAWPEFRAELDEEAFFHYLSFLTTPAPSTLFRGVQKLPAGCRLIVEPGRTPHLSRYYDLWSRVIPRTGSRSELEEELRERLRIAVEDRQISDRPVGVFLSGGIDSTTNAVLFGRSSSTPVRTFSVGYDRDYPSYENELDIARKTAEYLGTDHSEYRISEAEARRWLETLAWQQDEPIADPVCIPVYFLAKLTRDHGVPVAQVGEGADELFCGYPYWRTSLRLESWSRRIRPQLLKRLGLVGLRAAGKVDSLYYELLRRSSQGLPIFWSGAEGFGHESKWRLISPRLKRAFRGATSWDALAPLYRDFREKAWDPHPFHWMSTVDLSLRLPELLLMRVDKMAMAVSLEARVPFLDHRLVEFALGVSAQEKLRDGRLKGLLVDAMRTTLPPFTIERPKRGFGVPLGDWLFSSLGRDIEREVHDFATATDLFDRPALERILKSRKSSLKWILYNAALWYQTWKTS